MLQVEGLLDQDVLCALSTPFKNTGAIYFNIDYVNECQEKFLKGTNQEHLSKQKPTMSQVTPRSLATAVSAP